MSADYFLNLARQGFRAALAMDLSLHEEPDPEATRRDGVSLGQVIEPAAQRWNSPLALPLMDMTLHKADRLAHLGIAEYEADRFHFAGPLDDQTKAALARPDAHLCPGSAARDCALSFIRDETDLFPIALEPVILSLGSSRKLWEDAALVPKTVMLHGNLPSQSFGCNYWIGLTQLPVFCHGAVHLPATRGSSRSRPNRR